MSESSHLKALGEVADIKQGRYLAKEDMATERSAKCPVPVHGANGIIGWTDRAMYPTGVPLVTCRGSNSGMVLWAAGPLWVSNNAMAIIPFTGDLRFAYYCLLNSPPYETVSGSAQPQITRTALAPKRVMWPAEDRQRSISRVLSVLDDKIELNRRMNETLEAMAQAIFRDWFVDFGPVRRKLAGVTDPVAIMGGLMPDAARAAELGGLFPDALNDEGLPEGWTNDPLSSQVEIIGGGTPKTGIAEYWGGPIPWFSVADTPSGSDIFVFQTEKSITQRGLTESSVRLVPAGTTIISARGTVGNLAIAAGEMTFNQSCYALRSSRGDHPFFVYLSAALAVEQLRAMAHGSVFSTITRQTFDALSFPTSSAPVLEAFEGLVSPLFARIRAAVSENRTLAETRDYLLPRLMSGEVRVLDASPEIAA